MKDIYKLLKKLSIIIVLIAIMIGAGFLSNIDQASVVYSLKSKHELLQNTTKPRIIFVGGSNLRFGLMSQMVKDSLKLDPINTAIFAGFGLKFIFDDIKPYLKKGDIVVLAPEYGFFFGDGTLAPEQLTMGINVCPQDIKLLNINQLMVLVKTLPSISINKLKASAERAALGINPPIPSYERCDGMNKYGDTFAHWNEPNITYIPETLKGSFNDDAVKVINEFSNYVRDNLKGQFLVSFPPFPIRDFNKNTIEVNSVENNLRQDNLVVISKVKNYVFADSLFFNSSYHLNKLGDSLRTVRLIGDIKDYLKKKMTIN